MPAPKRVGKVLGKRAKKDGPYWVELSTDKDRENLKLVDEWDERAKQLINLIPYIAAHETFAGVLGRIPKSPEWREYRRALRVVRVGPRGWGGSAHALYGRPRARADEAVNGAESVLYVRSKKNKAVPASAAVLALEKYSPWTLDALPFSPRPSEAVVVVRRVSKREVEEVRRLREADKPKWRAELNKAGARYSPKPTTALKARTVTDIAFAGLRLEFGYGGTRPTPHWKPSIKEASRFVRRLWKRRGPVTDTMTKLHSQRWRKWPPKVPSSIRIAELKTLAKFQKKLRIRV